MRVCAIRSYTKATQRVLKRRRSREMNSMELVRSSMIRRVISSSSILYISYVQCTSAVIRYNATQFLCAIRVNMCLW